MPFAMCVRVTTREAPNRFSGNCMLKTDNQSSPENYSLDTTGPFAPMSACRSYVSECIDQISCRNVKQTFYSKYICSTSSTVSERIIITTIKE
jgi:hypothetical protein